MLATACAHTGASLWEKNTCPIWELLYIYISVVDTSNGNINCITASTSTIINTITSYASDMHKNASSPSCKEPVTIIRLFTKLQNVHTS